MKTTSQEGYSTKLELILVCHESRPGCKKMTKNVREHAEEEEERKNKKKKKKGLGEELYPF